MSAEGADRLRPEARAFLWRHRTRTSVGVGPRSKFRALADALADCGWLDLEWYDPRRGRATYTIVAVPVTPAPGVRP